MGNRWNVSRLFGEAPLPHWGFARLTARPIVHAPAPPAGDWAMLHDIKRDTVIAIPSTVRPGIPAPLLVCFHGPGGDPRHRIDALKPFAERQGIVLLAPASKAVTWDCITGGFGVDVERVDRALAATFENCAIDPERIAIEGFSDGASYALTLGLANGNIFSHIFAFSPRTMKPPEPVGKPRIFVTHGTRDAEIPVSCSRDFIVPALREDGYDVEYREFDGEHEVTHEMTARMFEIFAVPSEANAPA